MLLHGHDINQYESTLKSAKRVAYVETMYQAIRKSLKLTVRKALLVLVSLIFLPFFWLYGFYIRLIRSSIQKIINRTVALDIKCTDDYVYCKKLHQRFSEFSPKVVRMAQYNLNNVPYFLKFPMLEMKELSATLLLLDSNMGDKLDSFNTSPYSPGKEFKLKTEKELWEERCKAYSYIM